MSQTEETTFEQQEQEEKTVPVSESIRYRRRAQAAEKKTGELEHELAEIKTKAQEQASQLQELAIENKLITKLIAAGASDIETAALLAQTRIKDPDEIDAAIEHLVKEKPHLFKASVEDGAANFKKTAAAKDKALSSASALQRAARTATQNAHSRASLQEYMKLRRKF